MISVKDIMNFDQFFDQLEYFNLEPKSMSKTSHIMIIAKIKVCKEKKTKYKINNPTYNR